MGDSPERFQHEGTGRNRRAGGSRMPTALVLLAGMLLAACTSASMEKSMELTGLPAEAKGFEAARREPLNARAHIETGLSLLARPGRTSADTALAKSGFQTASRLAPDLWEPLVGLAAAHYRLGEYREALIAFSSAVERRGTLGDFALPYALVAYRAQEPELARLAFASAAGLAGKEAAFLDHAFSQSGSWRPQKNSIRRTPATTPDGERNILIEAFLIRDTRNATLNEGINLLDSLSLQFGGTLVNYTYEKGGNDRKGDMTVTLPSITYSLNLATRDLARVSIEASPVVMAREGKTSKFLEGGSVLIVPNGDASSIERDVGITVEVTPDRIGKDDTDLTVTMELSNITSQSLGAATTGANVLQTDKSRVETVARVPFGKAVLVGSAGSLTRRETAAGSVTAAQMPGLSTKGTAASRRDVLVLVSVRRDDEPMRTEDGPAIARKMFKTALPAATSYGERPSDTPDPQLEAMLMRARP